MTWPDAYVASPPLVASAHPRHYTGHDRPCPTHTLHKALRATIAVPEDLDWQLLVADEAERRAIVAEQNGALVSALEAVKELPTQSTWGDIASRISSRIDPIEVKYPNAGISDSEGHATIANFFALNWEPAMYDFLRYRMNW
jgi:hypothetical protein